MIINIARRLGETKEYYFSVKLQEIREMVSQGKDVINMAIGSPDMAPSEATIAAMIEHVKNKTLHDYPPYKGLPQLRQAIAKWSADTYKIALDPEFEILPLIGSKEGITHLSLTFLDAEDEALVPELGYPAYRAVTEMVGARARTYLLQEDNGWAPDLDDLEKQDLSKVKLMWLNYPHMPTGATASLDIFESLVAFARKHRILLCHDNPYSLVLNTSRPTSIFQAEGAKEVAVELNSFSKSHNMAGWRIGWMAGAREYIDAVFKVKTNVDTGIFKPLQLAAAKALENPAEWHEQRNAVYGKRRGLALEILKTLGCTVDENQTGMFLWGKLPEGVKAEKFIDHLLYNYHIFISPGFIFGPKGEKYIRASLCIDEDKLNAVKDRLKNFESVTL